MSRKILLAEDDTELRQIVSITLSTRGYEVTETSSGEEAWAAFQSDGFDIVVSDVRMQGKDGIELLRDVRGVSNVPFIIMTGFSEILEAKSAYALGATEFLAKPFSVESLLAAVRSCLEPKAQETNNDPSRFCRIHVDEFISTTRLLSDVFIKLADRKIIKAANKGDTVPVERLRVYKEKKVDYLYVRVEDFPRYVQLNIKISRVASANEDRVAAEKRAWLFNHTTQTIVQKCFVDGLEREMFHIAQGLVEDTLKVLAQDPLALNAMLALQAHSDPVYVHSVAVSLYSCLLVKSMGWHHTSTLFKVSTAGLFHDIGKKEIDEELLRKKRIQMTAKEIKVMESHPHRGRDILKTMSCVPEEVGQIVAHHHEQIGGTGYPSQLKSSEIHPLAKLIHVIDLFCHSILPSSVDDKTLTPELAFRAICEEHASEVDGQYLRALGSMFGFEVAKKRSA